MTKEEWLNVKKMSVVPAGVWHSFYLMRGGKIQDLSEFWKLFESLTAQNAVVTGSDGRPKRISRDSAVRNMFNYYDLKFGTYDGG